MAKREYIQANKDWLEAKTRVTIGDNVSIGAGSVVVGDIPSNTVAVGNPCKVIKYNMVKYNGE